ncbi:hypothetical protein ILUMI_05408 [Ignelater luminosus]|uniref:Sodium/bile acid cotransporter n=1 Tax=Ignelater luminosus TaxID=2038154 RepID=A0A8K0GK48_IGNLU|nr:hypothetical protein ILUMI_05408 [Ignelater luminosus]
MKSKPNLAEYLKKHWLLVGIFNCIFLASLFPSLGVKEGPLRPEYTVKYGAVSIIFFISGLSLKTDSIYYTLRQHRLHLFIQGFTFVFIPIFIQLLIVALNILGVDAWIIKGLITVACMPPPVSSAVILTKAAQGNETAAIFNSIVGSFLGIIVTPLLLLFNLGFTTVVPLLGTVVQLSVTVLFPLLLGQSLRKFTEFRGHNLPLNGVSQCALLFVIYTTFCDTFHNPDTGLYATDILVTMILVLLIQMFLLLLSFSFAKSLKYFTPADVVCAMFCSTHKSLTLGIPILRIMFHGLSHLSQISLPLLVYHPTQMILGGLLVSNLKDWVNSRRIKKPPV